MLPEIQILINRIDSIHSERFEKLSVCLELTVIVLIFVEILFGVLGYRDGQAQQRTLQAIESNTRTPKAHITYRSALPGSASFVSCSTQVL